MTDKPKDYKWVFILGHPFHRTELIKFFILICVLVASISGVGTLIYLRYVDQIAEATLEPQVIVDAEEASPLEVFMMERLQRNQFDQVESIRLVGEYTYGQTTLEVELLAKFPNLYRQRLSKGNFVLTAGFDGESLWLNQTEDVLDTSDTKLERLNSALAVIEGALPALEWCYEYVFSREGKLGLNQFELLENTTWRGKRVDIVRNHALLSFVIVHYFDAQTGYELFRTAEVPIGDEEYRKVEIFYGPPLKNEPYPVAESFKLYVDRKLFCQAVFKTAEFNRGLLTYLFRPDDE